MAARGEVRQKQNVDAGKLCEQHHRIFIGNGELIFGVGVKELPISKSEGFVELEVA